MSKPALRFSSVGKSYGRAAVLQDVSFEIASGEFFGLVGVNGAGKTTLLKCLLDFCDCGGGIEIFGISHRLTVARRRLAFLPERFNPPYFLTGADFIRYVLELQSSAYDRSAAEAMLGALDLDLAALDRPVRAYSKGMTQKLGLAACFLSAKDLYVLDEPTSGLDPKARALLKSHLRELKRQARTVFLTSHALADVAEVCDRMAVMHAGKLLFFRHPWGPVPGVRERRLGTGIPALHRQRANTGVMYEAIRRARYLAEYQLELRGATWKSHQASPIC